MFALFFSFIGANIKKAQTYNHISSRLTTSL